MARIRAARRPDGRSVCSASSLISGGGPSSSRRLRGCGQCRDAAPERPPDDGGREHDHRERHAEEGEGDERHHGQHDEGRVAQPLAADADHGLHHDRDDRRREAEEQRLDQGGVAVGDVDARQHQQRHDARQDEEDAGDERAPHPVEQPADVRRQLLGLGAGEQRAVGQREEEPLLADPALLLDQRPLHHRDLARRSAEGLQRDGEPCSGRDAQRDHVTRRFLGCRHGSTEPLRGHESQAERSTSDPL